MPFLPLLEMYTATGCLNKKLCCSFETLLFFRSAMMAFPDGTRDGKLFRRILIFTQCSNQKKWRLKGYQHSINPLHTSPTPPLPYKNVQHTCRTLYSMPALHTVWCGNHCTVQCSMLCMPSCGPPASFA